MTASLGDAALTLDEVGRLANRYGTPIEDALLIAINLHGIASKLPRRRARVRIRLVSEPEPSWQLIVPLNAGGSPFRLDGDELSLSGVTIGQVKRVDADEAVGGYFRDGGRAATLNPNARSRCVGCAFCPTLRLRPQPTRGCRKSGTFENYSRSFGNSIRVVI